MAVARRRRKRRSRATLERSPSRPAASMAFGSIRSRPVLWLPAPRAPLESSRRWWSTAPRTLRSPIRWRPRKSATPRRFYRALWRAVSPAPLSTWTRDITRWGCRRTRIPQSEQLGLFLRRCGSSFPLDPEFDFPEALYGHAPGDPQHVAGRYVRPADCG